MNTNNIIYNITTLLKIFLYSKNMPLELPRVIQFPIIDTCNSRCKMCNVWKNKDKHIISDRKLRTGLRNPLYRKVTNVGINGGEPTLRRDIGLLTNILFEELPKLNSISLITNGYDTRIAIERIEEVSKVVHNHNGTLDVMVSLDGFGQTHNRIRRKEDYFNRAKKVINFLKKSKVADSIRVGCTIIKDNVYDLSNLLEFCIANSLYIKYRIGIPHKRLYAQNLTEPFNLNYEEKYHVVEFIEGLIKHYESSDQQRFFYRSLINQLIHNSPRISGCDWRHRGVTITATGDLLYCAVESKSLGKIFDIDSKKVYFENENYLKSIISNKCDQCIHDYTGLPFVRRELAILLFNNLKSKLKKYELARNLYTDSYILKLVKKYYYKQLQKNINNNIPYPQKIHIGSRNKSIRRVLICGWYGTETLGDKAILAGVIHAIHHSLTNADISVMSFYPYITKMTCHQMTEMKKIHIKTPQDSIHSASKMDLIVFGGGPIMAIEELIEIEALFYAAKKYNVPTIIAGCGVGPLGDSWHNESIFNILNYAKLRIYRDERSKYLAGKIGVNTDNDFVAEDPAFTWLDTQQNKTLSPPKSKILILGLRDFPYSQYARHLPQKLVIKIKKRYENEITYALERLVTLHPDLIIYPIPMCTNHFGDDDRWFYRKIFRGNKQLEKYINFSLLGKELSPSEYFDLFTLGRASLTMRFHSIIFSLALQIPTVSIDYTLGEGKVHSISKTFDIPSQSISDITSDFIIDNINKLLCVDTSTRKIHSPIFSHIVKENIFKIIEN